MTFLDECKKVPYKDIWFYVHEQVYEPREDSFLIADNLKVDKGERVLDLGAGCGILGILAAKQGAEVVATDINPYAVRCARINAEMQKVKIDARQGFLFEPVQNEKFDLILFNPPYLKVKEKPKEWIDYSYSSSETLNKFLRQYKAHLTQNGRAMVINSSLSGIEVKGKILDKKKLPFEEIFLVELER